MRQTTQVKTKIHIQIQVKIRWWSHKEYVMSHNDKYSYLSGRPSSENSSVSSSEHEHFLSMSVLERITILVELPRITVRWLSKF